MQNKMRNKYTNKALKANGNHFNNYKGEQGYSETVKIISFTTIFKYLICFIIIAILAFHLINL